jgi:hypothetical protein
MCFTFGSKCIDEELKDELQKNAIPINTVKSVKTITTGFTGTAKKTLYQVETTKHEFLLVLVHCDRVISA